MLSLIVFFSFVLTRIQILMIQNSLSKSILIYKIYIKINCFKLFCEFIDFTSIFSIINMVAMVKIQKAPKLFQVAFLKNESNMLWLQRKYISFFFFTKSALFKQKIIMTAIFICCHGNFFKCLYVINFIILLKSFKF